MGGRTWQESFQKSFRSLETGFNGWGLNKNDGFMQGDVSAIRDGLTIPNPERIVVIHEAFLAGFSEEEIIKLTMMDPWFVRQLGELYETECWLKSLSSLDDLSENDWYEVKRRGFSDVQISRAFTGVDEMAVRKARTAKGVTPSMKRVDTCAAEFQADTPYLYSSYDGNDEAESTNEPKILILGGGPNRIGQGIEFDYCCCHAAFALSGAGYETIMLNSNPEAVSTDYDTSDRLYFEPLTVEDVLNVCETERPEGIIVQFGGQTPLSLATRLEAALKANPIPAASGNGFTKILGTPPDSIDAAEDRERWIDILDELQILQPPGGVARSEDEALVVAEKLGYPVMVRPSYVLGGRAMEIVGSNADLKRYIRTAVQVDPDRPVLVDKYLQNATEIDCDALCDTAGKLGRPVTDGRESGFRNGLSRQRAGGITRVHTGLLDVFHDTTDDDVASRVAQGVTINFRRILKVLVDKHRSVRVDLNGSSNVSLQIRVGSDNFHRTTTEDVRGANHDGVTELFGDNQRLVLRASDATRRLQNLKFVQNIDPTLPIFSSIDGVRRSTQNLGEAIAGRGRNRVRLESSLESSRETQRSLTTKLDDDTFRTLSFTNVQDVFDRQRFEIQTIRRIVIR